MLNEPNLLANLHTPDKACELPAIAVVSWSIASDAGESRSDVGTAALPLNRVEAELAPSSSPHLSRTAEWLRRVAELIAPAVEATLESVPKARFGVVLGSSTGGMDRTEIAVLERSKTGTLPESYSFFLSHSHHTLLHLLHDRFEIAGPSYVVSTACSSGAKAIAAAVRLIQSGMCDAVLTGGVDALSALTRGGFQSLGLWSSEGCLPFTAERKGLNLGEGAALLLLGASASASTYLVGTGESNDAYDQTAPHPGGLGAELAMRRALDAAGLGADEVDYVNAHGTGTLQNDKVESAAIHRVLGPKARYSSTKHHTQHQLGAAGATEAVTCIEALTRSVWPLNVAEPYADPSLAIAPLTRTPIGSGPKVALSNSFAFGGSNACLAFSTKPGKPRQLQATRYFVMSSCSWHPTTPEAQAPANLLPTRMRGRSSPLSRLAAELFTRLEQNLSGLAREVDRQAIALVFGSAYGELETSLVLLRELAQDGRMSPLRFQASVHNTAVGQLTQVLENRGYATALAAGSSTFAMSMTDALAYLRVHGGDAAVLCADETGPSWLLRGKTFPSFGAGVLVRASVEVPLGARAELLGIRATHESSQVAPFPLEFDVLELAPITTALPLLDWLEGSRSEQVSVSIGPNHVAVLAPVNR